MGIDLILVPIVYERHPPWFPFARVLLDRDYNLFNRIREFESLPIPEGKMYWYDDDGVKSRTSDVYGTPLRFVRAGDFIKLFDGQRAALQLSEWNKAAIEWVKALPKTNPIVLFWS